MYRLIVLVLFLLSFKSIGCSCYNIPYESFSEKVNSATEVFEGKIISDYLSKIGNYRIYRIRVITSIKGAVEGDIVEITTGRTAASCGQFFSKDSNWLVFGYSGFTGRCSGNINLNEYRQKNSSFKTKIDKGLSLFKKSDQTIEEYDNAGNLIAKGSIDRFSNPIGKWNYYNYKENCIKTRTIRFDSNSCILSKNEVVNCDK